MNICLQSDTHAAEHFINVLHSSIVKGVCVCVCVCACVRACVFIYYLAALQVVHTLHSKATKKHCFAKNASGVININIPTLNIKT